MTITGFDAADDGGDPLINAINAQSESTGVVASRNVDGNVDLTASDDVILPSRRLKCGSNYWSRHECNHRTVTLQSDASFTVAGTDPGAANLTAGTQGISSNTAVDSVDVTSQSGAEDAIARIDRAIEQVSSRRAGLGAMQNRLESTINNLSVASENSQIAQSRIQDADFAKEAAELLRQRILERSSIAMSGQANISQQAALQLLN